MHQMAVNGSQTACLIWLSGSPQALCNLCVCVCFTVVNVFMCLMYTHLSFAYFDFLDVLHVLIIPVHRCQRSCSLFVGIRHTFVCSCTYEQTLVYQTA